MAEKNIENRLSTTEANFQNISTGIKQINDQLATAQIAHNTQHLEVIQRLAIIETSQKSFARYQDECDEERTTHSRRIDAVEGYQSRQKGALTILSAAISAAIAFGAAIFEHGSGK